MGLTTKEIGSSSFNDMISSVDRRSEYVENRAGANVTLNNFLTPYTLDNKSSILNAPCGYSNGMYASLRPEYKILPNEIIDEDSLTLTGWSRNGNVYSAVNASSNVVLNYLNGNPRFNYSIGDLVQVSFTISDYVQGEVRIQFSGGGGASYTPLTSANGTYTYTLKLVGNNTGGAILSSGTSPTLKVSNVSFRKVQKADFDFTRGSSATRVNEKGLIEDVQILSSNLVQNGDFEEIGSELINLDTIFYQSGWQNNNDGSATFDINNGGGSEAIQGGVLQVGKIYKFSYNVNFTGAGQLRLYTQTFLASTVNQSGTYTGTFVADGTDIRFKRIDGDLFTIDNVSVKEVGQNWIINGDNFSIVDSALRINRVTNTTFIQQNILTSGRKYKVEFDVLDKDDNNGTFIVRLGSNNVYDVVTYEGTRFSKILTSSGTDFRIYSSSNNGVIYVDNISVIEITDDTDIPRIDYTSGTGALLLEPQSMNKLTYSEDFSDGSWTLLGSIQANSSSSPDGLTNATKFTRTDTMYNLLRVNLPASTLHVTSVFVKNIDANNFYIRKSGASYAYYNFDTKTVNDNSLKVEYFSNDWIRLSLSTEETSYRQFGIGQSETDLSEVGNSVYVWGAQLEQGSYATSYIPTEGSTVTRNADVANNSGNANLFNDSEGVLYAEVERFDNDTGFGAISIGDGTGNNQVVFKFRNTTNIVWAIIKSGGVNQAVMQYTASDLTVFNKLAIKYKANDFALWFNGVQVLTDTSGIVATGLNTLALQDDNGSEQFRGNVKCVAVFKEALTDAELAQITSATQQEVFYEMRDRMLQINADYYEFGDYTTRLKKLF